MEKAYDTNWMKIYAIIIANYDGSDQATQNVNSR